MNYKIVWLALLITTAIIFRSGYAAEMIVRPSGGDFIWFAHQAENISLMRVTSVEIGNPRNLNCKYKYTTNVIFNYKGRKISTFYSSNPLVIDSDYLMMGNASNVCGDLVPSVRFFSGAVAPFYPLLPYGFARPDDEAWVAVGGADFQFPSSVEVVDEPACYIPTKTGLANPCLVPPPVVRFKDLDRLLKDMYVKPSEHKRLPKG